MTVVLKMFDSKIILEQRGLGIGGPVQKMVDQMVLDLCNPYTPKQVGNLIDSGILGTEPGNGEVIWNSPYARYLYYGKLMVTESGSCWARFDEKKHLTNKLLTFNEAPKRGAFWAKRMKQDHLPEIINAIKKETGTR